MKGRNKMNYNIVTAEAFIAIIALMPARLAAFLTSYTAEEYASKGATCYLSDDIRSGYAITTDGELISVFSLPGAKQGIAAIRSAVQNGARRLDCLGPKLVKLYKAAGFVEYDRLPWDEQYAPENWDYDSFGRPDVVFMEREDD
jgi:hypothetical protein